MSRPTYLLVFLLFTSCVGMSPTDLKFNSNSARAPSSETIPSDDDITMELQVSDKNYVYSVIDRAFDITGTTYEATVRKFITSRPEFGGACDRYEASVKSITKDASNRITQTLYEYPQEVCAAGFSASSLATSGAGRYAYTLKTCDFLLNTKDRFQALMKKIYPDGNVYFATETTITQAYGLFFMQEKPSQELLDEFMKVRKDTTPDFGWKLILLSICSSPEWQII